MKVVIGDSNINSHPAAETEDDYNYADIDNFSKELFQTLTKATIAHLKQEWIH